MPKEYFQVNNCRSFASLQAGARIHVIGVSGVAMAQMAILLSELGFLVSGSDKDFFEPMGGLLAKSKVQLKRGYAAENVPLDADLVLIGNVVSYGHPEVEAVEKNKLSYTIFPKLLRELIIDARYSVVISGTHGKTTTSAWSAWLFNQSALQPSFFIGGAALDLSSSLTKGAGKYSVVEGDEYDSAFFAKVPKFSFYAPDFQVITSLEFDHADIYSSLEEINAVFSSWVTSLSSQAKILLCLEDKNLAKLSVDWRAKAKCKILTYGAETDANYRLLESRIDSAGNKVHFSSALGAELKCTLKLLGRHNALNALAVWALSQELKLDAATTQRALSSFRGVKRRQELKYNAGDIVLIEDFAHHPTAVRETLQALRLAYPGKRLWAVFEPRSNTSRKKVFQKDYIEAFKAADRVTLCEVQARAAETDTDLLRVSLMAKDIGNLGIQAESLEDPIAIAKLIQTEVRAGDVLVVMSNGSFGGLVQRLVEKLS